MKSGMRTDICKRIAFNVRYLTDKNDVKIGDLENYLGVCRGYFSRFLTGHTERLPVDIAYGVAQYFGVSIDDLCSEDFKLRDFEEYAKSCGYRLVPAEEDV